MESKKPNKKANLSGKMEFLPRQNSVTRATLSRPRKAGAFLFAFASLFSLFFTTFALASGPSSNRVLNYQIRLTDSSGIPVANGTKNLKLTFFTASSGGTQLYTACSADGSAPGTPTAVVATFASGTSTILIGSTLTCASGSSPVIPATLFDNTAIFLGVTVEADAEMTPRKRIVAAGYALNADKLDDLETSAVGGSNAFVPVTDSSGNFTLTRNVTVDTDTFFVDATSNEVGIGTVSPDWALHVEKSVSTGAGLQSRVSNTSTTTHSFAVMSAEANNGAVTAQFFADGLGTGILGTPSGYFGTFTNHPFGVITNNVERMRVTAAGNVGIGDTDPANFKLELGGSIGPGVDDTHDLGSNTLRWRDLYLGPATLHIGTATGDEAMLSYDTTTNALAIDSTGTVDINGGSGST